MRRQIPSSSASEGVLSTLSQNPSQRLECTPTWRCSRHTAAGGLVARAFGQRARGQPQPSAPTSAGHAQGAEPGVDEEASCQGCGARARATGGAHVHHGLLCSAPGRRPVRCAHDGGDDRAGRGGRHRRLDEGVGGGGRWLHGRLGGVRARQAAAGLPGARRRHAERLAREEGLLPRALEPGLLHPLPRLHAAPDRALRGRGRGGGSGHAGAEHLLRDPAEHGGDGGRVRV